MNKNRFKFASHCFFWHLLISFAVALFVAAFVFLILYPYPYNKMLNVEGIFFILLGVDVVCGPLVTLILSDPKKSIKERSIDWSLISLIQIFALIYGLHAVWMARPSVLAFEKDRYVLIRANEVDKTSINLAPDGLRKLKFTGVLHVSVKPSMTGEEMLQNIDLEMHGLTPAMRPERWRLIEAAAAEMDAALKSTENLRGRISEDDFSIVEGKKYLPLTSGQSYDWVAVFDDSGRVFKYLNVDGF